MTQHRRGPATNFIQKFKPKAAVPTIPCQCCRGKGREPLPADYLPTLQAVRKFSHGVTGEALGLPLKATARATQLSRLERWGLIHRVGKVGKAILWKAGQEGDAVPGLPSVKRCTNCGEKPEWKQHGHASLGHYRLVHSTGTCPNRVVVVHASNRLVAKYWNESAHNYTGGVAR